MQFDKAYFLGRFSSLDTTVLRLKQGGDLAPEALAAIEEILLQRESDPAYVAHDVVEVSAETPQDVDLEASYSCVPTEIVARYWSLQEAEIVRGLLESEGIPAILADAYLTALNPFLVVVFGGIKVKVPAMCVSVARQILAKVNVGDYALGIDATDADQVLTNKRLALAQYKIADDFRGQKTEPICWNPDVAAVFGVLFTPIFSQIIHFLNWHALGEKARARNALVWAGASLLLFGGMEILIEAEGAKKFITFLVLLGWYFVSGRKQSVLLVDMLDNRYARRDWIIPLIIMIVLLAILGLP